MRDQDIKIERDMLTAALTEKRKMLKIWKDVKPYCEDHLLSKYVQEQIESLRVEIQKIHDRMTRLDEHADFNDHLTHCSKIVAGWPAWKMGVLRKQSEDRCHRVTIESDDLVARLNKGLAETHEDEDHLNYSHFTYSDEALAGKKPKPTDEILTRHLDDEATRTYLWECPITGIKYSKTFTDAIYVSFHKGCTTHKVTRREGETVYVPAPGVFGCVVEVT